jgi:hypothetical protein
MPTAPIPFQDFRFLRLPLRPLCERNGFWIAFLAFVSMYGILIARYALWGLALGWLPAILAAMILGWASYRFFWVGVAIAALVEFGVFILDRISRVQLSDPDLIREYVKAYRAERNRAETEARRVRGTLDRECTKAKAEIQRIVSSIAKGLITDDEAAELLGPAREQLARIDSNLAVADTDTTVVDLHPQAVQRFKDNLENLAAVVARKGDTLDFAVVSTFRALVESVVVRPRKAGEKYTVNIRGHLASLMGLNQSALMVVARERYHFSHTIQICDIFSDRSPKPQDLVVTRLETGGRHPQSTRLLVGD